MPKFYVEALETFIHRTTYTVEAESAEAAEKLCKAGSVGYDNSEVEEGDEVWIETVSIEDEDGNLYEDEEEEA